MTLNDGKVPFAESSAEAIGNRRGSFRQNAFPRQPAHVGVIGLGGRRRARHTYHKAQAEMADRASELLSTQKSLRDARRGLGR